MNPLPPNDVEGEKMQLEAHLAAEREALVMVTRAREAMEQAMRRTMHPPPETPTPMPTMSAPKKSVIIVCPPRSKPGDSLEISAHGRRFKVVVPPRVGPKGKFAVMLPAPNPAAVPALRPPVMAAPSDPTASAQPDPGAAAAMAAGDVTGAVAGGTMR